LAVPFHGAITLFYEYGTTLVVDLMRRGEPFDRWFNLGGSTYPHVHQEAQDSFGSKLMKVDVKIPEDVHNGRVKGKPKSSIQQISENGNLILLGLRHGLFPWSFHQTHHLVPPQKCNVLLIQQASAECICLRQLFSSGVTSSLWSHD
jgi:hypothetical protein